MCRCAPGSAPVKSPCGVFAGGLHRNTRDMLDLDRTPMATWVAGETAEVMYAITANHGQNCVLSFIVTLDKLIHVSL